MSDEFTEKEERQAHTEELIEKKKRVRISVYNQIGRACRQVLSCTNLKGTASLASPLTFIAVAAAAALS